MCWSWCKRPHLKVYAKSSTWSQGFPRILVEHNIHPLYKQRFQALQPDDFETSIAFEQWHIRKCSTDELFPDKVLFSNEASFTREEIFNMHNAHTWAEENTHCNATLCSTDSICGQCWGFFIGDQPLVQYKLTFRLTGRNYLFFLQQVLPKFLGGRKISATYIVFLTSWSPFPS